jgi:putative MATE family efflux protein
VTGGAGRVPLREIARLAGPALPVLAAEPLYLLVDTAVVGRLGAVPLAGLAIAAVLFAQVTGQLNFLSYGTTARAARLHGAGRRAAAVGEGVQATWLALAVGLLVLGVGQLVAGPVARLLGDGGAVAAAAESWLRVALFGAPLVLVTLAGNGWMRGVQDTARPLRYVLAGNALSAVLCAPLVHGLGAFTGLGLVGSAAANLVGQTVGAGLFLLALHRERAVAPAGEPVSLRPVPALLRAQLSMGRDLLVRSLAFQACFLSAAAVAARFGAATVAAHQVVLQLWFFMALVLDAVAIAGQVIVGRTLGAGEADDAYDAAVRMLGWSCAVGAAFAVVMLALTNLVPHVFTSDERVIDRLHAIWPIFALMQPLNGLVFALDGILIGAGDTRFLKWSMLFASVAVFVPIALLALELDWGIVGVWLGLLALIVARLATCGTRFLGRRWAVTGVPENA